MPLRSQHSARRNFLFNSAFTAINVLYPVVSIGYASRVLGPEIIGRVSLASSLASYFALLATAAIPLYGAREIARVRDRPEERSRAFSGLLLINAATTVAALLLYAAWVLLSDRFRSDLPLFAVAGLFIAVNGATLDWFFQGMEEFPATLVRNLAAKAASLAALFLLVHDKDDFVLFAAIGVAGAAAYNAWGIVQARRLVAADFRRADPARHLRPLGWLAAGVVAGSVYFYLDSVIVGLLSGDRSLGQYSLAMRIVRTAQVVSLSLTTALIPRIAYYVGKGMLAEYRALAQRSIHAIGFLCLPVFAVLWVLAPQVVMVVGGPEFLEAGRTLRLALPIIPITALGNFLGLQVMFTNGEDRALFLASLTGAVASLTGNFLLVRSYAQDGAAMAAVAAEAGALLVLLLLADRRYMSFRVADLPGLRYLLFAAAAAGAAWFTALRVADDIAAIALGGSVAATVYLSALALCKDAMAREFFAYAGSKVGARFREKSGPA